MTQKTPRPLRDVLADAMAARDRANDAADAEHDARINREHGELSKYLRHTIERWGIALDPATPDTLDVANEGSHVAEQWVRGVTITLPHEPEPVMLSAARSRRESVVTVALVRECLVCGQPTIRHTLSASVVSLLEAIEAQPTTCDAIGFGNCMTPEMRYERGEIPRDEFERIQRETFEPFAATTPLTIARDSTPAKLLEYVERFVIEVMTQQNGHTWQ